MKAAKAWEYNSRRSNGSLLVNCRKNIL